MTERTSSLCASPVMQGSMQSEETDGMEEKVIHMSDGHDGHFQKVGAVEISVCKATGQRCRPFTHTICVFERGIKPLIVKTL